jgi:hypothetical protein
MPKFTYSIFRPVLLFGLLTIKTLDIPAGFYFIRFFAQGRWIGSRTILKI